MRRLGSKADATMRSWLALIYTLDDPTWESPSRNPHFRHHKYALTARLHAAQFSTGIAAPSHSLCATLCYALLHGTSPDLAEGEPPAEVALLGVLQALLGPQPMRHCEDHGLLRLLALVRRCSLPCFCSAAERSVGSVLPRAG